MATINLNDVTAINFVKNGVTTALDKLIYNGTTVWENWLLKTGTLSTTTLSGGTWSPGTKTATTNFGKTVKINKIYLDVYYENGGAAVADNGKLTVYGYNGSTSTWVTLFTKSLTRPSYGKVDVNEYQTLNSEVEITQIKFSVYVSDNEMSASASMKVTEWYEKG